MLQEIVMNNLTALVLLMGTLGIWLFLQRPKGIPPGPWLTFPIIGNLFQVGTNPVKSFRKLRSKYGDVFSVYFSRNLVIAINGYDNLKDAFVKNGESFTQRPDVLFLDFVSKHKGILGSSGDVWREQRKLALVTLKNLGMGKNILEVKILEEICAFVEEIKKTKGKATNFHSLIGTSVSNVISSIAFGKRFEFKDPGLQRLMNVTEKIASQSIVLTFFPFLRLIPGDLFGLGRLQNSIDLIIKELVDSSLEEHLAEYDENNINDFISSYIKEMKAKEKLGETKTSIDMENLRASIWNLLIAGTESTATTIRWLLLYFEHYPEIQEKCFSEIQEKVGCDRTITLKDKSELPYLDATILETLRHADILPLSAFRAVTEEIVWNGYRIPKNAVVFPVIDSVLSDPEIWGDPENFRPERFLDDNGHVVQREEFIPFLFGPRNCIGESLARMELFLFTAAMIQKFEFLKPEGCPLTTIDPVFGITQAPRPFKVRAVLRK